MVFRPINGYTLLVIDHFLLSANLSNDCCRLRPQIKTFPLKWLRDGQLFRDHFNRLAVERFDKLSKRVLPPSALLTDLDGKPLSSHKCLCTKCLLTLETLAEFNIPEPEPISYNSYYKSDTSMQSNLQPTSKLNVVSSQLLNLFNIKS